MALVVFADHVLHCALGLKAEAVGFLDGSATATNEQVAPARVDDLLRLANEYAYANVFVGEFAPLKEYDVHDDA